MRALWTLALTACCVAPIAAEPRAAKADSASSELYDDMKSVVSELITQEFADSATLWLTCEAGALPVYYLRTLQRLQERQWGSLQSTLRDDTANLVADFVYTTSARKLGASWDGAIGVPAPVPVTLPGTKINLVVRSPNIDTTSLLAWLAPTPNWTVRVGNKDMWLRDVCIATRTHDETGMASRRIVLDYIRNVNPNKTPALNEQCSGETDAKRRLACSLGRAAKAALQGKQQQAEVELLDFVSRVMIQMSPDLGDDAEAVRERILTGIVAWSKGDKSAPLVRDVVAPISQIVQGVVAGDCGLETGPVDYAALAKSIAATGDKKAIRALACAATRQARLLASGTKVVLAETSGGKVDWTPITPVTVELAEIIDVVVKPTVGEFASEDALLSAIACRATLLPGCNDGKYTPRGVTHIALPGGGGWTVSADKDNRIIIKPDDKTDTSIGSFLRALVRLRNLQEAVRLGATALLGKNATDKHDRVILNVAVTVQDLLRDLDQLRLFSNDGKVDAAGMFDAALKIVLQSPRLCSSTKPKDSAGDGASKTSTKPNDPAGDDAPKTIGGEHLPAWCKSLTDLANFLDKYDDELRAVVASAAKRDIRTLAVEALKVALPPDPEAGPGARCTINDIPYRRLTLSFVTYMLADGPEADGREVSRQAFRTAAIETLRCLSDRGLDATPSAWGVIPLIPPLIDSSLWSDQLKFYFWSVGLRASWSAGYRNQAGDDGYRTVVSAPGLVWSQRLTTKQSKVYLGFALGLLEYFGPLSELALRKVDPNYHSKDTSLWLDFVRPRLDLVLGVPLFSQHLALTAGGSIRTVAPFPGTPDDPKAPDSFTYLPVWSTDIRAKDHRSAFWEFNVAAHYVF